MEEENTRTNFESVPDFVNQLFVLSTEMLRAGLDDWAIELRANAQCIAEGLGLDK